MKYPFNQIEIITAILLVETPTRDIYRAAESDQYLKRADAREDWAYRELKA